MGNSSLPGKDIWTQKELYERFAAALRRITPGGANLYGIYSPLLAVSVNNTLLKRPELKQLLGANSLQVMFDNHLHHARFIHACLVLRAHQCLVEVVHWVYRSYAARGFDFEYFRIELRAWHSAISHSLGKHAEAPALLEFYALFAEAHDSFCALANAPLAAPIGETADGGEATRFLDALLKGDETGARALAPADTMQAAAHLPRWWERVVAPALHMVGTLWAEGRVTVAQEHVATAIAQRVLTASFPSLPGPSMREATVAVVVPAGERHTVGAEIIRDYLTVRGHRVLYTGADTPAEGVLTILQHNDVSCVVIPTTMPTAFLGVMELVRQIRESPVNSRTRIVVGGQAYRLDSEVAAKVGADICIHSLDELGEYLDKIEA